ncbi:MAG: hypothetical protein LBE48_04270 [Methanomassiliicoccaceae archaeon]|nr:hypothetical protein [Methanomassiliicoccaceae archaeon]
MEAFNDPKAVKVLSTNCPSGYPHSIVCGSIRAVAPDTLIVGEILMKSAAANLGKDPKAALLVNVGLTSYAVYVKAKQRVAEGPMLDAMNKELAAMKLRANAVWVFEPVSVYDQSANPAAGKKIA